MRNLNFRIKSQKTLAILGVAFKFHHSPCSVVSDIAVLVTSAATAANADLVAAVPVVPHAVLRLRRVRRGGGPAAHPSPVLVQHPTLATPPASSAGCATGNMGKHEGKGCTSPTCNGVQATSNK